LNPSSTVFGGVFLSEKKLLHHGLCSEEFEPRYVGTDYFTFYHIPCEKNEPWYGHSEIVAVLIDNSGRVIFNLQCRSCGYRDALKTHPFLWIPGKRDRYAYRRFFLSPKLKSRVQLHWWDNL